MLFNISICENIVYGNLIVSEDEIDKVISFVYLDGFIVSLDKGDKIFVGECGLKVLGGEK